MPRAIRNRLRFFGFCAVLGGEGRLTRSVTFSDARYQLL
jgi:hypothetical protein